MEKLRILIDDEGQCRTQRAVLGAFAASLREAEIAWSSQLPAVGGWADAPPASARRLRTLVAALSPMPGRYTLHVPGYVVPGMTLVLTPEVAGAPVPEWTNVIDLDLFLADNGSPAAAHFAHHARLNPDYQSCSAFAAAGLATVPPWIAASGLASPVQFTSRPWYAARVPARAQWLAWVGKALQEGRLSLQDVEADVQEGLARPSLLQDATALTAGEMPDAIPDVTLDGLFTCPEMRVSDAQHAMLHSRALQARTLRYHRMEASRKHAEAAGYRVQPPPSGPLASRTARNVRTLARNAMKRAYRLYSVSLRPLLRRGGATPPPRS